jgi:hypothetical protein
VFTHSVVEVKGNNGAVLSEIQSDVVPKMAMAGATLYAIWTPRLARETAGSATGNIGHVDER